MTLAVKHAAILSGALLLGACNTFGGHSRSLTSGIRINEASRQSTDTVRQLANGKLALQQGNYATAVTAFRVAAVDQALAGEANNGLGIAYVKIGRGDLARRYFRQAIAAAPGVDKYQDNLIRTLSADLATAHARQLRALTVTVRPSTALREIPGSRTRAGLTVAQPGSRLARIETGSLRGEIAEPIATPAPQERPVATPARRSATRARLAKPKARLARAEQARSSAPRARTAKAAPARPAIHRAATVRPKPSSPQLAIKARTPALPTIGHSAPGIAATAPDANPPKVVSVPNILVTGTLLPRAVSAESTTLATNAGQHLQVQASVAVKVGAVQIGAGRIGTTGRLLATDAPAPTRLAVQHGSLAIQAPVRSAVHSAGLRPLDLPTPQFGLRTAKPSGTRLALAD